MKTEAPDYGDLPRQELMKRADEAITSYKKEGIEAVVHFKFTCEKCGERLMLQEENSLFESGECHICGHDTVITKGGFALHIKLNPPKKCTQ